MSSPAALQPLPAAVAAEDALWRGEDLTRGVLDAILHGIAVLDGDGCVLDLNRTAEAMLGHPRESAVGERLTGLGVPVRPPLQGRSQCTATRADGTSFVAEVTVADIPGAAPRFAAHIRDVTAERDAEAQLDRRAARQRAVAELGRRALTDHDVERLAGAALDLVADLLDADLTASEELRALGDGPAAAALADDVAVLHDAALPAAWREHGIRCAAVAAIDAGDAPARYVAALQRTERGFDGDELDFLAAVAHVLGWAHDRHRRDEEMRRNALLDPLTGLANRTLFVDRVRHALTRSAHSASPVAVLALDLDRFKHVNDALGHERGDELLEHVAVRLREALRPDDTLARFGADEFGILSEGVTGERGAIACAERVLEALARPIVIDEHEVVACASIGIVLAEPAVHTAEGLIRDAGVAMDRAKEQGGGRYELFDQGIRQRMLARITLEQDLRRALEQDQFELYYQPIVSLEERRIIGLEALVRWNHPVQGVVQPSAFIPVAEASGLIVPLGRWVLLEACRQAARWENDHGLGDAYVSVNLSGRQLADPAFGDELTAILERTGLSVDRLALEVTESVLMEETSAPTAVLQRLKALGVHLLLDDFGTGYSSLNYVKRFPIEAIKVDRSFIESVAHEESDRHILAAIVSMAASLDVDVIAEGVEEVEQARWLRHLGITLAQGYAFARPAPAAAVAPLLRNGLALDRLAAAFTPLSAGEAPEAPAPAPGGGEAGERRAARVPDPGATLTLGEAATALDVSTSTLRRWADDGRIRTLRTSGGHRRFPVAEVRRLSAAATAALPPAVRVAPLPTAPLAVLADVLGAETLPAVAARALYEPQRAGWFASPAAADHVRRWLAELATAARDGAYAEAVQATRRLVSQADYAGTALGERHAFVERTADAVVRGLSEHGAAHGEVVEARRLFANLRQVALDAAVARTT
jgi:diguanylate cyclase (GGDEF)-like protein/excisionase family DNA binding protein/PAS domain S-box-containing protein